MKVGLLWHATEQEVAAFRAACPPGTEFFLPSGDYLSRFECRYGDIIDDVREAEVLIGWTIPRGIVTAAEKLKLIVWLHSGLDGLRYSGEWALLTERKIRVANVRGANAIAVAEHGIMLMLALAKKTIMKHQAVQEGRALFPLYADAHRAAILHGRTLGLIGLGNIGERVARHAKAFDMTVLAVRKSQEKSSEYVDEVYGMDRLHPVLGQSDYVMLALPCTEETEQFWGKGEFAAMKPSAFLINISRGMLIQEKHLYEALVENRIGGFAADVWWWYWGSHYPTTAGQATVSRLGVQKLPNVICSSDQATNADDVHDRYMAFGVRSLEQFASGNVVATEVCLKDGY